MATFDVKLTSNELASLPWPPGKMFTMEKTVDFSVAANYLAQDKIMSLFKVPADVVVLEVRAKVLTVDSDIATSGYLGAYTEAANGDITVVDEDGFQVTGLVLNALGWIAVDPDAAFSFGGASRGYASSAEWHITYTNKDTDTVNAAKVNFVAICVDLR